MFYVRAQSPSIITFITLDLRTNSKALLKEINKRISEEEKTLQIILMSVPHKLNQASVRQPGLSVCRPPGSVPTRGRETPSKPPPLAPVAGTANPLSDAKLQPLSRVPGQKNHNFKSTSQAGSKLHPPPSFPRSPVRQSQLSPWRAASQDQAQAICPSQTAGKATAAFPSGCTAPGSGPVQHGPGTGRGDAVLSHRLSCPCTPGADG